MPRRSKRKSWLDTFIERAKIAFVVVLLVLFGLAALASEQPMIAFILTVIVAALVVAIPVGVFILRRRTRRREVRRHVKQAKQLGQLLTVSGEEFEDIAVDLFQAIGYRNVERIGGSGDLGVDLVGRDPNGRTVIIQCKRYGRGQKIGSPAVQTLMGAVVNNGADKGIFVTTSTFTAPAVEHARTARVPIDLIDGDALTQLANTASTASEATRRHEAGVA